TIVCSIQDIWTTIASALGYPVPDGPCSNLTYPAYFLHFSRWPNITKNTFEYLITHRRKYLLTWDSPSTATSKLRRRAAIIANGKNPDDTTPRFPQGDGTTVEGQWDEYPYASTRDGGSEAGLWLVPRTENAQQGGNLGFFYRYKLRNAPKKFRVLVAP